MATIRRDEDDGHGDEDEFIEMQALVHSANVDNSVNDQGENDDNNDNNNDDGANRKRRQQQTELHPRAKAIVVSPPSSFRKDEEIDDESDRDEDSNDDTDSHRSSNSAADDDDDGYGGYTYDYHTTNTPTLFSGLMNRIRQWGFEYSIDQDGMDPIGNKGSANYQYNVVATTTTTTATATNSEQGKARIDSLPLMTTATCTIMEDRNSGSDNKKGGNDGDDDDDGGGDDDDDDNQSQSMKGNRSVATTTASASVVSENSVDTWAVEYKHPFGNDRRRKKRRRRRRTHSPSATKKDTYEYDMTHKSSIAASIFNLVNNVAGAGILALPSAKSTTGTYPAMLILVWLGIIAAHTFILIGHSCEITGENDFKGLWRRTMGAGTSWIMDTFVTILCLACAVIYSGILGDAFTPLLALAGIPDRYNHRWSNIVAITVTMLLPLSLVKNLSSLAYTSFLGFASVLYTVVFISVRSLDGTYHVGSGKFVLVSPEAEEDREILETVLYMPEFKHDSLWHMDYSSLVLVSNLGLFFLAHYNAPTFYRELADASTARFTIVVGVSFAILIALYATTMMAGYWTFGDVVQGNILLNYHPGDLLATLGRFATGFSILFGFPLIICGAKEGLRSLITDANQQVRDDVNNNIITIEHGADETQVLKQVDDSREENATRNANTDSYRRKSVEKKDDDCARVMTVVGILLFCTVVSINIADISLIMGLTGAAIGAFLVYVCPVLIYARAVALTKDKDSIEYGLAQMNLILVPFGVILGALGVYMTIQKEIMKNHHHDDDLTAIAATDGADVMINEHY